MPAVLTKSILEFVKDRLRANYVDDSLYDDDELLAFLNDAYRDACEQSRCLVALYDFTLADATQEYDLPADFAAAINCWAGGVELENLTLSRALTYGGGAAFPFAYYTYGTKIGFAPVPSSATAVTMLYAQLPTPLATYDDTLDERFGEEYADILVHYVRWRVQMTSGGAERIGQARYDRNTYDFRVSQLRHQSQSFDGAKSFSMGSVAELDAKARGRAR